MFELLRILDARLSELAVEKQEVDDFLCVVASHAIRLLVIECTLHSWVPQNMYSRVVQSRRRELYRNCD